MLQSQCGIPGTVGFRRAALSCWARPEGAGGLFAVTLMVRAIQGKDKGDGLSEVEINLKL